MTYYYIIDEDDCRIVSEIYGTKEEALKQLQAVKEVRQPGDPDYWHVLTLFGRLS